MMTSAAAMNSVNTGVAAACTSLATCTTSKPRTWTDWLRLVSDPAGEWLHPAP